MTNVILRDAAGDDEISDLPPVINEPYRFFGGLSEDLTSIWAQRELLRSFISRELRQRYKGSVLGWGWALVRPLVLLAVYGVAVGVFLGAGRTVPEFAVYLYTGLIAWGYFSTIITGSILALPNSRGLIGKAAFQKELLIVAVVVVAVIDLAIQAAVLVVGYWAYGSWPSLSGLFWIIPAFVLLTLLGLAFGLALSASNVYFRDVGYLTEVGLQVGFWMVPILYTLQMVQQALGAWPTVERLFLMNPIVPAINGFRLALWPAASTPTGQEQLMSAQSTGLMLAFSILAAVSVVWLAQRYFSRVSSNLAEEL